MKDQVPAKSHKQGWQGKLESLYALEILEGKSTDIRKIEVNDSHNGWSKSYFGIWNYLFCQ